MQGNFTCYAKRMQTQPTVLKSTKCHEYKQLRKIEFDKNKCICTRIYIYIFFLQSDTVFGQRMSYSNLRISLFWNSILTEVLQNEEKSKINQVTSYFFSCLLTAKPTLAHFRVFTQVAPTLFVFVLPSFFLFSFSFF